MRKNDDLHRAIVTAPELQPLLEVLRDYRSRVDLLIEQSWHDSLSSAKSIYVAEGREDSATAAWCLETIASTQDHFIDAFLQLKCNDFYEAWCLFERVEIALHQLARHYMLPDDEFGLRHMETATAQFQSLYPYRWFASPGMVVRRATCSICGEAFRLTGGCEHELGEIYKGEMCCRVLNDIEALEISIVEKPVQKYSVLFSDDISYDYGPVHYVTAGLASPWHEWSVEREELLIAREGFPGTSRNAPCPCGSKRKYKKCCVLKPRRKVHYQFSFVHPLPEALPTYLEDGRFIVKGVPEGVRLRRGAAAEPAD
ncbi:MAG TPA: SEC-C metal-binding domain-containing protein [Thermoanaerobaculia bacterium]|nr:SEC-C metal-binding domain-containing protein [Thermoanaerobaculia bacterium]